MFALTRNFIFLYGNIKMPLNIVTTTIIREVCFNEKKIF